MKNDNKVVKSLHSHPVQSRILVEEENDQKDVINDAGEAACVYEHYMLDDGEPIGL